MIRLATHTDIPLLVGGMLELKQQTGWSKYVQPGYNPSTLADFLQHKLLDHNSVCYVWDADGITAFCGGTLHPFALPPHMPVVSEWGWYGTGRPVVQCWQEVKQWAKRRGAELAHRVLAHPGRSSQLIREQVTWEVL